MQSIAIVIGLAAALGLGLSVFLRTNPAVLAGRLRGFGWALLALAGLVLVRGQIHIAIILAAGGVSLLTGGRGLFGGAAKAPRQTSRVQTVMLRMALDHDSGAMDGEVLSGPMAGRRLSALSRDELLALLLACQQADPKGVPLVEGYLDHRHPDWREAVGQGSGQGGAGMGAGTGTGGAVGPGRMTAAEARQVLAVGPQASVDEINAAWRAQMKRNHPDQGGSSYLAAKINEAKDVLLG